MPDCCCLGLLGAILATYICYCLLKIIYEIVYPFYIGIPLNLTNKAGGEWAVITGSTDGIGKEYALQLARKNFSIVLIARSINKLESVKEEILKSSTAIEVKTIVFDFTSADIKQYQNKILNELEKLNIGILVNNVGMTMDYPEIFHKSPGGLEKIVDLNIVNMLPATVLCGAILPKMVERNSGIIVNISSAAAYRMFETSALYSSAKAYVSWFTKVLQREYANTNIIIQLVCPLVVITNMAIHFDKFRPSSFNMKVNDFVSYAIRSIGLINETTGCPLHELQVQMFKCIPDALINGYMNKEFARYRDFILEIKSKETKDGDDLVQLH